MNHILGNRQAARWLALAGLSATAFAAQAGDVATGNNGVMTFPHVQVVSSPVAAADRAKTGSAGQAGMTAFIDPATGQFTGPTAQDAAALEAAKPTVAATSATQNRRSTLAARTPNIYPAQGGVGVALDDSTMQYSVARKDGKGQVVTDCVPGQEVAHWTSKKTRRVAKHASSTGEQQ